MLKRNKNQRLLNILPKISERLNITESDLKNAINRKIIAHDTYKNQKYILFKKKYRHIERGTILFLNENLDYIMGYPKIRRAMVLDPTLKNYFIDKIAIEEKLDGYNVRIAKINNTEIVAITRGGRICPFTTKKALKFIDTKILNDYPDIMLCGEMIGLNNPYVPYYYPEVDNNINYEGDTSDNSNDIENLGFYIFDIRNKETNKSLTISQKGELLKKYNLPHIQPIDIVNKEEISKIKEIILKLDHEKREGIILKDPDMVINPIKYTTHHTQCSDLSIAFTYMYDLGINFMFSRLVREGYQSIEFNENKEEMEQRAKEIGESILYPMINTIKKVSKNETIREDFEIFMDNEEDLNEFLVYLKKLHIAYVILEKEQINNSIIKIKIGRLYNSTNDKIKSHLNGNLWSD
ncbi:RNA ligase [Methanococcus aeolicus]|nr:RNA ligase [Methanococcus aeolicus]